MNLRVIPRRSLAVPPVVTLFIASLLLAACGASASPSAPESAGPTASGEPSVAPSSPPSVAPSDGEAPTAEPSQEPSVVPTDGLGTFACDVPVTGVGTIGHAQIIDVRVGQHDGYDRVVFEFSNGIPEFRVEPDEPPFHADGSGFEIDVDGEGFLRMTLLGGTKVSPVGGITYQGPTEFEPDFDELVHLVEGGDFEAVSTWYAGLRTPPCIRVLTLSDPARLAIDIQH